MATEARNRTSENKTARAAGAAQEAAMAVVAFVLGKLRG